MTITVTDVNDKPVFEDENGDVQATTTRSVAENTAAGQPVGAPVAASDDDNDSLTYSLGGTDAASFDIDTSTGQIKVKDALDYEGSRNSYSVTVSVHDGKDDAGNTENSPTEDASIGVTINVEDLNEKPAFDAFASATLSVGENTAADTNIGAPFTATDPDPSDTLTYSLGGTDAASFAIDTGTGQVKTKADLDHEGKGTYGVTVQVSDGRNDAGDAETPPVVDTRHAVTITVTDADDDGVITLSADPPSVGTTLTATLTDDDGVKSSPAVTWKWESSPNGTDTWAVIDGETTNTYTPDTEDIGDYLRVTATYDDELGSGKTAEKVSKAVLSAPATNLQPEFTDETTTRSVVENTAAGEDIGAPVSATHADSKGTLVYSLDTAGDATFDIDSSTGQLKTEAALDYESDTSYTVTVSVRDGLTDYSVVDTAEDDSIEVTIDVTNIDIPAVPEAPTVVATQTPAAGLEVTWTALTPTATVPVDGYDVQYREKDTQNPNTWGDANVTVNGASATITGLGL